MMESAGAWESPPLSLRETSAGEGHRNGLKPFATNCGPPPPAEDNVIGGVQSRRV